MLEIAGQAPVTPEPIESALHDPAVLHRDGWDLCLPDDGLPARAENTEENEM